jgi:hypothetical protein
MKSFQTVVAASKSGRSRHVATEDLHHQGRGPVASARLFVRWRQIRTVLSILAVAMSVLCRGVVAASAQESSHLTETVQQPTGSTDTQQDSSDIAKQAQNPIAKLISVPFENDFYPHTGTNKEDEYVLEIKPVVPIALSKDWNLITRTIIPVIQTPEVAPGISGTSGLGDIQESLFFSPTKAGPGGIIWGAGPVISAPTATENIYGTGKMSMGPTLVVLKSQGHWLFGSLVQNLWSVETGPRDRPAVNQMLLQPFVNYNLPHKWYLTSSPIITSNWEVSGNNRWTVPVGGGVGKIVHFGKLPVNAYTQFFRNVERPDGTTSWSARFQMQFLFPKK